MEEIYRIKLEFERNGQILSKESVLWKHYSFGYHQRDVTLLEIKIII